MGVVLAEELLLSEREACLRDILKDCTSEVHAENALKVVYALCQVSTQFCQSCVSLELVESCVSVITAQVRAIRSIELNSF